MQLYFTYTIEKSENERKITKEDGRNMNNFMPMYDVI